MKRFNRAILIQMRPGLNYTQLAELADSMVSAVPAGEKDLEKIRKTVKEVVKSLTEKDLVVLIGRTPTVAVFVSEMLRQGKDSVSIAVWEDGKYGITKL